MLLDLRYSLRGLLRSRGLAVAAIGVLSISGALAMSVFAVIDTVLLRPLPVRSPEQLRYFYSSSEDDGYSGISYTAYERLQPLSGPGAALEDIAVAGRDRTRIMLGPDADVAVAGEVVSGNYFALLGIESLLGRTLTPSDDEHASEPVVVISESLFASKYLSDPAILGTAIHLKPRARGATSDDTGRPYTIVGVIGSEYRGLLNPLEPSEYWVPIRPRTADYACHDPQYLKVLFLTGFGRLNAARQPDYIVRARIAEVTDPAWIQRGRSVVMTDNRRVNLPFGGDASAVPEHVAYTLLGVCLVLLAIGTTNLVGLLFSHNLERQQEFAVRLLLGASPRRVITMVVFEGAVLAVLGCSAGLVLAVAITHAFTASIPLDLTRSPLLLHVEVGRRTALAMLPVALATAAAIALPSAIHLLRHTTASGVITAHAATPRHVRSRLRWIVFPQVVLSVMLLTLAGVLVQSLAKTQPSRQRYDAASVAFIEFELPAPGRCHRQNRETTAAYIADSWRTVEQFQSAARTLPGIESVSTAIFLPHELTGRTVVQRRNVTGPEQVAVAGRLEVGSHFFRTMRIPVLQGRGFDGSDRREQPRVAVISHALADALWRGGNPVGESIGIRQGHARDAVQWAQVVGIVGDVAPAVAGSPPYALYLSIEQTGWVPRLLLVRHGGPAAAALRHLTEAARRVDPRVEIHRASTIESVLSSIRYPRRVATGLLALSGTVGMVLAGIGIFGLVGYVVRQRTREIGIRTALGALQRDITILVVKEALTVGIPGAVLGMVLAFAVSRIASAWALPLALPDAVVLTAVGAFVTALVVAASYPPARRATQVDPATVLRTP